MSIASPLASAPAGLRGQRLRRLSTAEETVALLRARIVAGELAPGTALREVALAQAIGVSRPTLREALQALKHEGLVQHEAHRGMFVAALGPEEIVDLYQVRRVLETSAARACARAPQEALAAVQRAFDSLAATWGSEDAGVIDADLAFHQAIVGLLASPRLDAVFDSVAAALRPCLALLSREARASVLRPDSLAEHAAIATALAGRQARVAERRLAAHVEENQELLLRVVEARPA